MRRSGMRERILGRTEKDSNLCCRINAAFRSPLEPRIHVAVSGRLESRLERRIYAAAYHLGRNLSCARLKGKVRNCFLALLCFFSCTAFGQFWVTAYYPGWEQGSMAASTLDYSVLTHVIHFSVVPKSDATLDSSVNGLSAPNSSDVVSKAHAAGRKVLVCVGGAGSQAGFQGATTPANRATFVLNLVNFMSTRGYDGIDIDWEPLDPSDADQYTNFVSSLRTALNSINPRPLMTAAIASPPTPPSLIASVQARFDQINLMTYDLSGPYAGWVTWFNAPIFDGGYRFASTGGLVPSADGMIGSVTNAGVPSSKLGIGIAFYGWIWSGGNGTSTGGAALPRQSWSTAPSTTQLSFNDIMSTYYQSNLYHWDTAAQAAYLSIDNSGSTKDKFISYDDERTCQSKVSYARNAHLGGVMIWEVAQDHTAGQPDPLLQAIKQALATPGPAAIQQNGSSIDLSFTSAPLGLYRIQWSSNLPAATWNNLVVTNQIGTGGVMHVLDPGPLTVPQRFYRVETPP